MKDEAFFLACQWRDDPALLAGDLTAAVEWLRKNSTEAATSDSVDPGTRTIEVEVLPEARERFVSLHKAIGKYIKLLKTSKLPVDLFAPVVDALCPDESAAEKSSTMISIPGLDGICESIAITQRWADKQTRLRGEEGNRSELLKTTIEHAEDGLLVKTDMQGSLKLRGSTNIPMFLAFFRNAKHRLTVDAFLDIDRTVKPTNLDRHRVRLSSKLHDVLIEIVSDKDGYQMRTYR